MFGTGEGFLGYEPHSKRVRYRKRASGVRTALRNVFGTGEGPLWGTERDGGHGWYTGGASEVRNGEKEAVGTPQCILVYEMCGMKDLYTR